MIFYKQYTYAPRATLVSALFSLLAMVFVVCAGALGVSAVTERNYIAFLGALLLGAAAVLTFIYGSRRLPDKIAAKDGPNNIRTKASYAVMFVRQHPEAYEQLQRENPDFAVKYVRDETSGKIVRRKNR